MPARDIYHGAVIKALTADGWTITNDPLYLGLTFHVMWKSLRKAVTPSVVKGAKADDPL
ncbi:element excision factor XisH family protein [Nostoc sp.]|uniref:element excision factor XisH family protein n=1 Tax=Nostoc sp. TaxID=1180 RepID=UPI002FF645F2